MTVNSGVGAGEHYKNFCKFLHVFVNAIIWSEAK